jgi:hypothetical protein
VHQELLQFFQQLQAAGGGGGGRGGGKLVDTQVYQEDQEVEVEEMINLDQGTGNTPPVSPPQGNNGGVGNLHQLMVELEEEQVLYRRKWYLQLGGAGGTGSANSISGMFSYLCRWRWRWIIC